LVAFCENCEDSLISKCGSVRKHHFAHRGERSCDTWHEPITEWHVEWQDRFPSQWQEVCRVGSSSSAKHFADVFTAQGLTIEFQHSYLSAREREERESFYGNMVWVVDAYRKSDFPRFLRGIYTQIPGSSVYLPRTGERGFPPNWLNCRSPVLFDFGNSPGLTGDLARIAQDLWCLIYLDKLPVVVRISRDEFVRRAHDRAKIIPIVALRKRIETFRLEERQREVAQARLRADRGLWQYLHTKRLGYNKRRYAKFC
jgi:hypothetical protein